MPEFSEAFRREVAEYAARHGSHRAHERWPQVPARTARQWRKRHGWSTDEVGRPSQFVFTRDGAPTVTTASGADAVVTVSSKTPNECEVARTTDRRVRTLDDLIDVCEIDVAEWDVVSWEAKAFQQGMRPWATGDSASGWARASDAPRVNQLFSVTAKLKRKVPVIDARREIEDLVAAAKERVANAYAPLVRRAAHEARYLLEVCLPDMHFGRLAWGRETGGPNYDLTIAVAACLEAVDVLLARSAHLSYERVLLVVGNDLLNADSNDGKTTKGTPQDNDGRHFKVFQKAREVKVAIVERLVRDVAPVDVVVIPGNHDRESTLHLGDSLAMRFHAERYVTVDCEPTTRKYYDYGQNLIGITHGDQGKPMLWSRLMPVEAGAQWGRTRHREVHCGHLHHESAVRDEVNGVKVRHLPSLAPPSAWEAGQGYVDTATSAEAFHWHAGEGVVGTAVFTKHY